jgi:hypothetical protein
MHRKEDAKTSSRVIRDQKRAARRRERDRNAWSRDDFFHDLKHASSPMTDAINADPKEVARLKKSRQQVKEGDVHWGAEDADDKSDGTA